MLPRPVLLAVASLVTLVVATGCSTIRGSSATEPPPAEGDLPTPAPTPAEAPPYVAPAEPQAGLAELEEVGPSGGPLEPPLAAVRPPVPEHPRPRAWSVPRRGDVAPVPGAAIADDLVGDDPNAPGPTADRGADQGEARIFPMDDPGSPGTPPAVGAGERSPIVAALESTTGYTVGRLIIICGLLIAITALGLYILSQNRSRGRSPP